MTNLQLIYIVIAALAGALLHMILQGGASWKQMLITGIISAVGFAVGYKVAGTVFGVIDICLALLGGYGVVLEEILAMPDNKGKTANEMARLHVVQGLFEAKKQMTEAELR